MPSFSDIASIIAVIISGLTFLSGQKYQQNKEERERIENRLIKFYNPVNDLLNSRNLESLTTITVYGQYRNLAKVDTAELYEIYMNLFTKINNNPNSPNLVEKGELINIRKKLKLSVESDIIEYKQTLESLTRKN